MKNLSSLVSLLFSCSVIMIACTITTTPVFTSAATTYNITDILGRNRIFDGIGGLSGGGATSVLLWTYPEPMRSEILDYLFLPNFGANVQILKVEIGGDAQSTDGCEPSHMHSPYDEDYSRGYEWWLMVEAKKRNPNIKTYALAWAFPAWVSCDYKKTNNLDNCTYDPFSYPHQTATYITKFIVGARVNYGIEIDYVGIWNERSWNDTYIEILRATLDNAACASTKIVAPDNFGWKIASEILASPTLAKSIFAIGSHYPGTQSTEEAVKTAKPLWASEDDSTYNNNVGAGCWARIINQNYINGNMSASINWNLIASYQKGTNWYRAGLTTALDPWSGSYGVFGKDGKWTMGGQFWATAHTTQFSNNDGNWSYLHQGAENGGAGHLKLGGSYLTLKNFKTGDFTIVVEKFERDFSSCVRPVLAPYICEAENVTLKISKSLLSPSSPSQRKFTSLHVWKTHFAHFRNDDEPTTEFEYQGQVPINQQTGEITINVPLNSIFTLTTIATGKKGAHRSSSNPPPQPARFPTSYSDNFNDCRISGEAKYFTDQSGTFECVPSNDGSQRGVVMQQKVPIKPIGWTKVSSPHSLIGHRDMVDQSFSIDAKILEPGHSFVFGTRCQKQNNVLCNIVAISAVPFSSSSTPTPQEIFIYSDLSMSILTLKYKTTLPSGIKVLPGEWHNYRMEINGTSLRVFVDGENVFGSSSSLDVSSWGTMSGWAMIGTSAFGEYTQYDNLQLYSTYYKNRFDEEYTKSDKNKPNSTTTDASSSPFKVGDKICNAECITEVGYQNSSQWIFDAAPVGSTTGMQSAALNQHQRPTSALIQLKATPSLCIRATPSSSSSSEKPKPRHHHHSTFLKTLLKKKKQQSSSNNNTASAVNDDEVWWLQLAYCNSSDSYQMFSWFMDGISPDHERQSFIYLTQHSTRCLDIYAQKTDIGLQMDAWDCNLGLNQQFFYDFEAGQIANEASVTCLGVC